MANLHKTPGAARLAALALGAVVAFSGQYADAASVTSSGVTGGCAGGIGTSEFGVINVLEGASWERVLILAIPGEVAFSI